MAARIGSGNLNHDTRCVAYDDSVVYRAEERKRKLMKNEEFGWRSRGRLPLALGMGEEGGKLIDNR